MNPTDPNLFFRGREGDPRLGELAKPTAPDKTAISKKYPFALIGFPDDIGVRLNRGRVGAKLGPDSIRKHLYKMTPPANADWSEVELFDWGNIKVTDSIEENHLHAQVIVKLCMEKKITGIFLGGGHDYAEPCFKGAQLGSNKKWGIINVDPHLDARPLENRLPHSGTAFRQLLDCGMLKGENLVQFGARANRNSKAHWDYCLEKKALIDTWETIQVNEKRACELFGHRLWQLQSKALNLGVTFDMDACAEAEGTSAAPVLGFSAWEMVELAGVAGRCSEVGYIEIAEVAPDLEKTERSSRIAAEMIHAFISARVNG